MNDEEKKALKSGEPKKTMETSKKMLLVLFVFWVLFTLFGAVLAWFQANDNIITILAGGLVSALTVGVGFYYWKARTENIIKLKSIYPPYEVEEILEQAEDSDQYN